MNKKEKRRMIWIGICIGFFIGTVLCAIMLTEPHTISFMEKQNDIQYAKQFCQEKGGTLNAVGNEWKDDAIVVYCDIPATYTYIMKLKR